MAIKFEKKFKMEDVILKDNEYHLWIVSFAIARQDLFLVNRNIQRILEGNDKTDLFYFMKMNVGHLNEAFKLLNKAINNTTIGNELIIIPGVKQSYDELLILTDGSEVGSFYKVVLFDARNNAFHYNNGSWSQQKKEYDFESTKEVLQTMYDENHFSGYKIGEKRGESDFYFAEEIQVNWIFELGKKYGLTEESLLERLSYVTVKIMELLTLIVDNFLIKR